MSKKIERIENAKDVNIIRKKLLSPFVTKKIKKDILISLFSGAITSRKSPLGPYFDIYEDIKKLINSPNFFESKKLFKIMYNMCYSDLINFYKSNIRKICNNNDAYIFLNCIDTSSVDGYEFLSGVIENLSLEDILKILANSMINGKIKEKIFNNQEERIRNKISSKIKDSSYMRLFLQKTMYEKVIDIAVNASLNSDNYFFIFSCLEVSDELKKKIFNEKNKQIEKLIDDMSFEYLIKNFTEKSMYKGVIDIITKKIEVLASIPVVNIEKFVMLFFNNPNIDIRIKDRIYELKSEEIESYISKNSMVRFNRLLEGEVYPKIKDIIIDNLNKESVTFWQEIFVNFKISESVKDEIFEKKRDLIEQLLSKDIYSAIKYYNCLDEKIYGSFFELTIQILLSKEFDLNQYFDLLNCSSISKTVRDQLFNLKKNEIEDYLDMQDLQTLISPVFCLFNNDMYSNKIVDIGIAKFNDIDLNLRNDLLCTVNKFPNEIKFRFFNQIFNINQNEVEKLMGIIPFLKGDISKFISNFKKLESFFAIIGIDINKFFQYSLAISYDWLSDIIEIVDNDLVDNFFRVKEYFFTKFYGSNISDNALINNFNILLKNYSRYSELLLSIVNSGRDLTSEEKQKIEFLFGRYETLNGEDKPINIDDCDKINLVFKRNCDQLLQNINNMTLDEIKNVISSILFNNSLENMINILSIYGNAEEMVKLQFNNRKHPNFNLNVSFMEILASMIEDVVMCNDIEKLKSIAINIINNYEIACGVSQIFSNYHERMRILYEHDSNINLTNITEKNKDKVVNLDRSNKYGVDVYDFSDKDYVLLAHVKSGRETIEQLANGHSSGEANFICLSAISYRNQVYFSYSGEIIFGYTTIPNGSFVCSSTSNMGSNSSISSNSSEVDEISWRNQRGILETSSAVEGYNSELLCFREGMKPDYIVLPGGREPTPSEIEVAKKYGLRFALTQNVNTRVENPVILNDDKLEENLKVSVDIQMLSKMKEMLLNATSVNKPRKIALFTDAHGLFEPTLAILEDARRNGITEIYSLGDNIGTGPNPSEVMDLLDKYGVKSLVGNHELYAVDGIGDFIEHLTKTGAFEEARKNSSWTRGNLTVDQVERIRNAPDKIELIVGGDKILLTHSISDFNSGKVIVSPDNYNRIFQGHIHFKDEQGNITTLRGAGIGDESLNAYYVVLTEKPGGGYEIEERMIPFDKINLEHDINLSSLSQADKDKIANWAHVGKGR